MISILAQIVEPTVLVEATSPAEQIPWFIKGYIVGAVIASVGLMVRLFRQSTGGSTNDGP